jgi:hypothetical protein
VPWGINGATEKQNTIENQQLNFPTVSAGIFSM